MNDAEVVDLTDSVAPAQRFATKAEAVDRARQIAKDRGGEILVHGRDGGHETSVRHTDGRIVDRSSTPSNARPARRL